MKEGERVGGRRKSLDQGGDNTEGRKRWSENHIVKEKERDRERERSCNHEKKKKGFFVFLAALFYLESGRHVGAFQ